MNREYDSSGRWRSESHATAAFDEEGRQATRTLDGLGRELRRLDPNGNTTAFTYYGATQDGRLQKTCDGENRCTTFEYDANGNVLCLIDNLNQDTDTQYDALNRPVRIAQATYTGDLYRHRARRGPPHHLLQLRLTRQPERGESRSQCECQQQLRRRRRDPQPASQSQLR